MVKTEERASNFKGSIKSFSTNYPLKDSFEWIISQLDYYLYICHLKVKKIEPN